MDKYVTIEEFQEMFRRLYSGEFSRARIEYEGIMLPPETECSVRDLKTWEVREDDVWVVTYPKAGTTWTQEIVSAVMHDGDLEAVRKRHFKFRIPFIDECFPEQLRRTKTVPRMLEAVSEMPSPRVLKSHLPGQLLPPQIWEKKPKIIYVIRNPKDLAVSFFHFRKKFTPDKVDQPFGEFLEELLAGKVIYGPWWDHYLYFWKKRHERNILFLRFENMKRDLRGHVEKISKFLGKNLSPETLDAITDHCSFANMKNNPMANPDSVWSSKESPTGLKNSFMRKGEIGNWKSHFTVAQNEAFDTFVKDKLRGTGLTFDYD